MLAGALLLAAPLAGLAWAADAVPVEADSRRLAVGAVLLLFLVLDLTGRGAAGLAGNFTIPAEWVARRPLRVAFYWGVVLGSALITQAPFAVLQGMILAVILLGKPVLALVGALAFAAGRLLTTAPTPVRRLALGGMDRRVLLRLPAGVLAARALSSLALASALAVLVVEVAAAGASPARAACPTSAKYRDRWPKLAAGGPSIGPVTLALGRVVNRQVPAVGLRPDGHYGAKVLILVDAAAGTPLELELRAFGHEGRARVTHLRPGNTWSDGVSHLVTKVPGRGQSRTRPADLPGTLLVSRRGCYQLFATVGSRRHGPFGLRF